MTNCISIITICYNNLQELIATCQSVDEQDMLPYEHWIIDGSSDNHIRKYLTDNAQPAYRKWVSEPDKGIGDAFNKGITLATGEIINMLNSGDRYADKAVLSLVNRFFDTDSSIQWLHGKYTIKRGGEWVTIGKPFEPNKLYRGMRSLCHQTMFYKKQLHEKHGLYDTSLTIAMDYDFVCRIAREPFLFSAYKFIIMAPEGISNQQYLRSLQQTRQVYVKHFGRSFKLVIWQWRLKTLHYLLSSRLGKLLYRMKKKAGLENL